MCGTVNAFGRNAVLIAGKHLRTSRQRDVFVGRKNEVSAEKERRRGKSPLVHKSPFFFQCQPGKTLLLQGCRYQIRRQIFGNICMKCAEGNHIQIKAALG